MTEQLHDDQYLNSDPVGYVSARVVLVGDSGVGKSSLALALLNEPWRILESTSVCEVHTFDESRVESPDGQYEQHEILLWDLAAPGGYRHSNQLQFTNIVVVLICYDARSESDPLVSVRYWNQAVEQVRAVLGKDAPPVIKYLVLTKAERGGAMVDAQVKSELGFSGSFKTSAKENWGIDELRAAIVEAINWDILPRISSYEIYEKVKQFLLEQRDAGLVLIPEDALYHMFVRFEYAPADPEAFREEFAKMIGCAQAHGLIRQLKFGKQILLKPELLDVYASSMVSFAREEKNGLGYLAETDARKGQYLDVDDTPLAAHEDDLLLFAIVEDLLHYQIALRDEGQLIFPMRFRLESADNRDLEGKTTEYTLEVGEVQGIFNRLAVRLARYGFKKYQEMNNAITYRDPDNEDGICGVALTDSENGHGVFTVFYEGQVSEGTRRSFEKFVSMCLHVLAPPGLISIQQFIRCPKCDHDLSDAVQRRLELGLEDIRCSVCEMELMLVPETGIELPGGLFEVHEAVYEQQVGLDAEALETKIANDDFDVFMCHNKEDKPAIRTISALLKNQGVYPWLDEEQLQPGLPWQRTLEERIATIKAAAVFIGDSGIGPWQQLEIETLLRQFIERECPVIPVILPSCQGDPEIPVFLQGMLPVDFRNFDIAPWVLLTWGITGVRDGS